MRGGCCGDLVMLCGEAGVGDDEVEDEEMMLDGAMRGLSDDERTPTGSTMWGVESSYYNYTH